MSTHVIPVLKLDAVYQHNNADALELVKIFGYQCIVRKGEFVAGDLVAYIEPDYMVPVTEPEFKFLEPHAKDGFVRITAKRLRGENSFGLVIPARQNWKEGDNVIEELGIKRYEPFMPGVGFGPMENEKAPMVYTVKYDMENYRRYNSVLKPGEEVDITEKLNGANSRFLYTEKDELQFHVGSHTMWKRRNPKNLWWKAAIQYDLENKLKSYPDHIFYGELYGNVGGFRYGFTGENVGLAFFDIMHCGRWLNVEEVNKILKELELPKVPVLYTGPWDESLMAMSDGTSTIADHIREGIVVKPLIERIDPEIGRVILKIVGMDYLEGNKRKGKKS